MWPESRSDARLAAEADDVSGVARQRRSAIQNAPGRRVVRIMGVRIRSVSRGDPRHEQPEHEDELMVLYG
jgi:hypothetical protein